MVVAGERLALGEGCLQGAGTRTVLTWYSNPRWLSYTLKLRGTPERPGIPLPGESPEQQVVLSTCECCAMNHWMVKMPGAKDNPQPSP